MRELLGMCIVLGMVASDAAQAADTETGQKIYERNCLACHGVAGAGDGPAARALRPPPTRFNVAEYWAGTSEQKVKAAIKTGRPGTSMMGFGSLTDEQLTSLVAYLRTLGPAQ
jgi:high-affinity iron transporter